MHTGGLRFNGRVQREVLGITIYSHRDLETLLKGFNQAYNMRRQRVLKGASPEQVVQRRLAAEPTLANRRFKPPDSDALPPALQVVAAAKEVSHPDNGRKARRQRGLGAFAPRHDVPCCVREIFRQRLGRHRFVFGIPSQE